MSRNVDFSRLPRMVSWFRPALLVWAMIHQLVAGLFGRYADQRVVQQLSDEAAADSADPVKLSLRHDYSKEAPNGEAFWVDFVADLGDGFSSTYSVAYLMAAESLRGSQNPATPNIRGVRHLARQEVLPHGRILIMGGDQVYPWPSREAYAERLQQPYSLALPANGNGPATASDRDVYAIPGNHDWYDGLGAFDELFCRSRFHGAVEESEMIGGWRTRQHRSYFALKLPHNWWVWCADIQLSQNLDLGQLRYFRAVSEQMGPNTNFVLVTSEPTWLQVDTPAEKRTRESLRQLIDPPLRRGAKLCGIFSGDTHHYSRYNESDVLGNFNLFIAGGGGAYIHGTHHLDNKIKLDWVGRSLTFHLNRRLKPKAGDNDTSTSTVETNTRATYPTRRQSLLMAASNVIFPWRNVLFTLAMGLIYWVVTWAVSEIEVARTRDLPDAKTAATIERLARLYRLQELYPFKCDVNKVDAAAAGQALPGKGLADRCYEAWKQDLLKQDAASVRSLEMETMRKQSAPLAKDIGRGLFVDGAVSSQQGAAPSFGSPEPVRLWILAEYSVFRAEHGLNPLSRDWWAALGPVAARTYYMLLAGLAKSPATAFLVAALFFALWHIAHSRLPGYWATIMRFMTGLAHFVTHSIAMWALFGFFIYANRHLHAMWVFNCQVNQDHWIWGAYTCPEGDGLYLRLPTILWEALVYPMEMMLIGGLVAGVIFGTYLGLGYILGGVNDDWAFSAQRSPKFRNFLRMKFMPGRLIVYPIGIDEPPRLRTRWTLPGWVKAKNPEPGKPLVEPRMPIEPRLIEGPIVIDTNAVRNIPRNRDDV